MVRMPLRYFSYFESELYSGIWLVSFLLMHAIPPYLVGFNYDRVVLLRSEALKSICLTLDSLDDKQEALIHFPSPFQVRLTYVFL